VFDLCFKYVFQHVGNRVLSFLELVFLMFGEKGVRRGDFFEGFAKGGGKVCGGGFYMLRGGGGEHYLVREKGSEKKVAGILGDVC